MSLFKDFGWLEKVGVVAAIAIVGMIVYYTTSGSSAFTLPPIALDKVYVATEGDDRNDGKTPDTAVRSFARALGTKASNIVLVGPSYVLPRQVEHLLASRGLMLDHGILITSNQTPWEGAPSSAGGGWTTIVADKTYGYLKFYNDTPDMRLIGTKFVDFSEGSYYFTEGLIHTRIAGVS